MDFERQFEYNRRALLDDIDRRIAVALRPYEEGLDWFLADLFRARLPADWRRRWHAFVADQARQGRITEPHSVREMEAWIESWARFCELLPVATGQLAREESSGQSAADVSVTNDEPAGEWPRRSGRQITLVGYPLRRRKPNTAKPPSQSASAGPPAIATKPQLPADSRGTWIKGTKGNGVFRYNNSLENRRAGIPGKELRFKNQYIAVGGFPPEAYYRGSAKAAGVKIETVTATNADNLAADAKMREKLKNPAWRRPEGYKWNHAGQAGSKKMELVLEKYHKAVAHKGPAAEPRAIRREAKARGGKPKGRVRRGGAGQGVKGRAATGRAMGALTVYLAARDALRGAGVLRPGYTVVESSPYHFVAKDGSVFVVWPRRWLSSAKLEFIAGPRKGQTVRLTNLQVDRYRKLAEKIWGKLIPGGFLSDPRFIPGTKRKKLRYFSNERGVGWIDEKGIHFYGKPGQIVI